jgi:putative NIF3 family GTP cyclohydrolase 1 type 2
MITRILFLLILTSCAGFAQEKHPTAIQIVDIIKQNTGAPWRQPTVDVFKAGDSSTTVTSIAVTMMATLDVLQRAAAKGHNLIITHETPFYSHFNPAVPMETYHDPVYEAKQVFIKEHKLVVWQFHDNIHDRKPDGIMTGMIYKLGWKYYRDRKDEYIFHLPPATLKELAKTLKQQLEVRALRVIGNPDVTVSTVGFSPGFGGFERNRAAFQQDGVEVLIIGEAHEWEIGEYAADAVTANMKKGLIILGHIPSEQAGMEECTRWLKTFIKNVPIEFIPAQEPFWVPE